MAGPFPLEGISVVDLTHALAGPYCTMQMAAYGADVVKVEDTGTGDIGRSWAPPYTGTESSYFLGLNAGKQGVAIDLKTAEGVALCQRLVAGADVLIENFRPGTLERLGLGYAAMSAANPRLVYCSISGYGQDGPRRDDPAMDLIVQAASGLISLTGPAGGPGVRSGHSVADITAGMFALIGIMMALHARTGTGQGQHVDVSMFDGMISAMASNYANLFGTGTVPRPMGTAFGTIVPYAVFPTADRDLAIAVASDNLWRRFGDAIERPDVAADPRFRTNALRVEHRGVLEPLIRDIFKTRPAAHWVARLTVLGVPCSPVNDLAEVVGDAQTAAREMFPVVDHPSAGPVRVTGVPVKFSAAAARVSGAAPRLGEHTRAVLEARLGLSPPEIDRLVAAGVVAAPA